MLASGWYINRNHVPMKGLNTFKTKCIRSVVATIGSCIFLMQASSQVCTDPGNVIFGLNGDGNIFPININTGVISTQINPAYSGNTPSAPNGLGYSLFNGKFYYFKRSPSSLNQEFVSFDPATNAVTILSSCPTTYSVYIGCMAVNGVDYYCWDSQSRLFYYNMPANTWTLITTSFVDQFGKDVDSIFRQHGSGDAAIDGNGNLLMLPSSNSKFGLFKLIGPLPTTSVVSVTVQQILPMANTPGKFVGIALNASGQIILNTSNPTNRIYRLENNLTLTLLSTMSAEMGDLTSCNFPLQILPESFKDFTATLKNQKVTLSWEITATESSPGFSVQYSRDAIQWLEIGYIYPVQSPQTKKLLFTHQSPSSGRNYYRVARKVNNQSQLYSEIENILIGESTSISIWPNPVQDFLLIENSGSVNEIQLATIFDISGRKIKEIKLSTPIAKVDISWLVKGSYIVSIRTRDGEKKSYNIMKR
jgi:hypothetical protein